MELGEPVAAAAMETSERSRAYVAEVAAAYREVQPLVAAESLDEEDGNGFQLRLFDLMIDFKLGSEADRARPALLDHRRSIEGRRREIEEAFLRHELSVRQFVEAFNELTVELQDRVAGTLTDERYRQLFELPREERMVVADPAVAEAAYPAR